MGYCGHAAIGSLVLLIALASGLRRADSAAKLRHAQLALYILLVFVVYLLSSFWTWPMTKGPRIALTLLIPLFWTIGMAVESAPMQKSRIEITTIRLSPWRLLYALLIAIALFQAYELATFRAALLYGGK